MDTTTEPPVRRWMVRHRVPVRIAGMAFFVLCLVVAIEATSSDGSWYMWLTTAGAASIVVSLWIRTHSPDASERSGRSMGSGGGT